MWFTETQLKRFFPKSSSPRQIPKSGLINIYLMAFGSSNIGFKWPKLPNLN